MKTSSFRHLTLLLYTPPHLYVLLPHVFLMNIDIDPITEEILDKALSGKEISRKEAYHLMRCT